MLNVDFRSPDDPVHASRMIARRVGRPARWAVLHNPPTHTQLAGPRHDPTYMYIYKYAGLCRCVSGSPEPVSTVF